MTEIKEECFFSWPEAFLKGTETVGGKGWNLAKLDRYGFAIPRGGILSADVYRYFIEENGLKSMVQEVAQLVTLTNLNEEIVSDQLTIESWRGSGFRDVQDLECIDLYNNLTSLIKEATLVFYAMMTAAMLPLTVLTKAIHKYFPGKENGIINALMAGKAQITSAEHGYRLMELAEIAGHDQNARRFLSSDADYLSWEKELKDTSLFKQAFRAVVAIIPLNITLIGV